MTLPNPPQPQPLIFPALTFAKLSPAAFLNANLTDPRGPLRPSGRTPTQTRLPAYNAGSLTHANGSAVVRCGDTAAVCGIRAEILKVEDVADYNSNNKARGEDDAVDGGGEEGGGEEEGEGEGEEQRRKERERRKRKRRRRDDTAEMASLNLLVPNLELATGCSPAHLPGGPPSLLAQTLTQRILTLLHTSNLVGMEPLKIWFRPDTDKTTTTTSAQAQSRRRMGEDMDVMAVNEEEEQEEQEAPPKPELKALWTLYIDILFISLDGNPFDAAWFALLAALSDTLLPRAWWDPDRETVLCSDDPAQAIRLDLAPREDLPIPLSFGVFEGTTEYGDGEGKKEGKGKEGKWVISDLDAFEEALCKEQGTVVVAGDGRIVRLEKSGGGGVGMQELKALVTLAGKKREEWLRVLGVK